MVQCRAKNLTLLLLKLPSIIILILFWLSVSLATFAQGEPDTTKTFTFYKSFTTKNKITDVTCDRYFNLYFADVRQNIFKYSAEGDSLLGFSSTITNDVYMMEAWSSLKVFVFYRDIQQFMLLDRYLTNQSTYAINVASGFARMATISADNNIWLFDDTDFSLKKFNLQFTQQSLKTPCDLLLDAVDYDITFMREYQNLLFVVDKNYGVLVFDNMGNYKKKIPFKGLDFVSFYNNELYFVKGNKVVFFDLYDFDIREVAIPASLNKINYVMVGDKYFYFFENNKVHLYKYQNK